MKKNSLFVLPLLAGACLCAQAQTAPAPAGAASAPEPTPMSSITGTINVTTNYKFRGQDQGTLKAFSPAVQGGFDWSQNGFYLGNWNSNVSFAGNIEMDFYGGYKAEIVKDVGYDVGVLQYYYPKNSDGVAENFNTTEIYGAVSYSFFSLKYSHTVSSDYFALGRFNQDNEGSANRPKGRNTGYLDFSANVPVVDKLTFNGHVGYTHLSSDLRNAVNTISIEGGDGTATTTAYASFIDWKAGATFDLGSGFSVAGAVVGATKKSVWGDVNKTRFIATISKSL